MLFRFCGLGHLSTFLFAWLLLDSLYPPLLPTTSVTIHYERLLILVIKIACFIVYDSKIGNNYNAFGHFFGHLL